MSDVERPNQNSNPARTMADVARLFLDGARQPAQNGSPKRLSPKERSTPAPIAPQKATTLPPVLLAFATNHSHLTAAAAALANQHHTTIGILGFHNNTFQIHSLSPKNSPVLQPLASTGATNGGGQPDMQIARALFTLRHDISTWLIATPTPDHPSFPHVASQIRQWLLITPADNTSVIAAYQQIKLACALAKPETAPSAFMLSHDPANAAIVHDRLNRAAKEFLKTHLTLLGTGTGQAHEPTPLFSLPLPSSTSHDPLWAAILDELATASAPDDTDTELLDELEDAEELEQSPSAHHDIESALDRLHSAADTVLHHAHKSLTAFDQLASVLDPEERAALTADLSPQAEESATLTPDFDIRSAITPPIEKPAAPSEPAPQAQELNPWTSTTPQPLPEKIENRKSKIENKTIPYLRVLDLPTPDPANAKPSRPTQWQAIERSILDLLPAATILEARPNLSWAHDSCIALTPDGHLHVWTLYQDGVSWFALREWATENKNLLALTRRDLPVDKSADVTVHIVLPLECEDSSSTIVSTLLRTPTKQVFLYRMRHIEWTSRRGLIVIPIA